MVHFREIQRFQQPWLWAILLGVSALCSFSAYWQTRKGHTATISLIVAGLALAFLAWFSAVRLVTEVGDDVIKLQFMYLGRAKRIALAEIDRVEAVSYDPIREYGGWGMRKGASGWAYNVSGSSGVRIHLRDGKNLLVGSQRSQELAQAIEARRR